MPPRNFANAASERIDITGTANLQGFSWTFGTIAFIMRHNSTTGDQCYQSLLSSGVDCQLFLTGGNLQYWNGAGAGSTAAFSPGTTDAWVVVVTKATGTATPRFGFLNTSTGVWSFANGSATIANVGTVVNVVLGSEDTAGTSNRLNAQMWEIAWWRSQTFTDAEMQRLGAGGFARFNPTAGFIFDSGRDNNALPRAYGRCRMKPSTHSGVTRGTFTNPPGWKTQPFAHRTG